MELESKGIKIDVNLYEQPTEVVLDAFIEAYDALKLRGEAIPALGGVATEQARREATVGLMEDHEVTLKERAISDFLNPEKPLNLEQQFSVMTEFWADLGHNVPELSNDEQLSILAKLEARPDRRVVPTPLLGLDGRKQLVQRGKAAFSKNKFSETHEPLWTPGEGSDYAQLLADPESTVKVGKDTYGLRYWNVEGVAVSREDYVASLKKVGRAVQAGDGTVWTFPVTDVQVASPRTDNTAERLHENVSPTNTPESLLAMQLLHQANGTPNNEWSVDFANEAIYKLGKKGEPVSLSRVVSVYFDPSNRLMFLNSWDADDSNVYFGVRAEESGL